MRPLLFLAGLLLATTTVAHAAPPLAASPEAWVPAGFVVQETLRGDLNRDGQDDVVLLIKATDKKAFERDRSGKLSDRNRRGVVVALKKNDQYEQLLVNPACFASDEEDGGVYFAPELGLEIRKGHLLVTYSHGRYGYWQYNFRYQNGTLALIGYDSSSHRGPVVLSTLSINFLTHKARVQHNLNADQEDAEPKFKETWSRFPPAAPILLQEIADFDALNLERLAAPAR